MACTVAPSHESKSEPSRPPKITHRNPDARLSGVRRAERAPIKPAPRRAALVPYNETPPEVPRSTGFSKLVIRRGRSGSKPPSSVAHVSALAAATAAANPGHVQINCG